MLERARSPKANPARVRPRAPQARKLPYDAGENPYIAADRFLAEEGLPGYFREQAGGAGGAGGGGGGAGAGVLFPSPSLSLSLSFLCVKGEVF